MQVNEFYCKVYYEDTDAEGIVYYANYLKFIERARTEFINNLGISLKNLALSKQIKIVVRKVNCDYLMPATLEDQLKVNSFCKDIRKTSFTMQQTITRNEKDLFKADVLLVAIDGDNKPIKIPEELLVKLKQYVI